ncbi:MAG: DnaB-like helicase C-terminal domain-containing protein [Mycoplasmoidaceae bacterium]
MDIHHKSLDTNDIEITILACLMNNHIESEEIYLELEHFDFIIPNNSKVFRACKKLHMEGQKVDFINLLDFFSQNKNDINFNIANFSNLLKIINENYLYEISILDKIDLLKKNSITRKMQLFGKELTKFNADMNNFNDKLYDVQTKFLEILDTKRNQDVKILSELLPTYQSNLYSLNYRKELLGCSSGYSNLDKITHGFQKGDMIVLAARPGIGKTALAINFLINVAKNAYEWNKKHPSEKPKAVLMFSMEMGNQQICDRLIANESLVDLNLLRLGKTSVLETNSISDAINRLIDYPILIDDSSNLSIIEVQSKIKQASLKYNLELVVIDYLQLLRGPQTRNMQMNRQQEVSNISKIIKQIARQYQLPMIAIAQLSRKIEERRVEQKRPILSDLRESGSIEQDADLVTFLSYKQNNLEDEEEDKQKISNECLVEYIISKHRNGETGIIEFVFKKSLSKYIEKEKDKYYEKN